MGGGETLAVVLLLVVVVIVVVVAATSGKKSEYLMLRVARQGLLSPTLKVKLHEPPPSSVPRMGVLVNHLPLR